MEDEQADDRVVGEVEKPETEHEDAVPSQVARDGLKEHPAINERERDGRRQDAPPHDEHVGESPRAASLPDEEIQKEEPHKPPAEMSDIRDQVAGFEKGLPTSAPIQPRGGALKPHRVPVGDSEGREKTGERVANQRGVDVSEVPGPDEDRDGQ